jgi:hypothetical protein
MLDALKTARADYLAQLLRESSEWPDRGRAYRSRLVGRIACDWDRLVANPQDREDPPTHGGRDARAASNRKGPAPMKLNALFPSRFFRADDLDGEDLTVTIRSLEICADFEIEKPVLHFEESEKGLVLNKTNAQTIAAVLGSETDAWIGQQVVLYVAQVPFQNRIVPSIRVRIAKRKAASKKPAGAAAPLSTVLNDDVPFAPEWR